MAIGRNKCWCSGMLKKKESKIMRLDGGMLNEGKLVHTLSMENGY